MITERERERPFEQKRENPKNGDEEESEENDDGNSLVGGIRICLFCFVGH